MGHTGPLHLLARIVRRSAIVAVAVVMVAPAVASAHTGGPISTDFEARIAGLRPPVPGVRAHVLEGDLKLQLTVPGPHVVVVLGLLGEPFLRFSAAGVQANAASPTAWNSGVVKSSDAVPVSRARCGARSPAGAPSRGTRTGCGRGRSSRAARRRGGSRNGRSRWWWTGAASA